VRIEESIVNAPFVRLQSKNANNAKVRGEHLQMYEKGEIKKKSCPSYSLSKHDLLHLVTHEN
jgi:hypothetical protein